jgi:hypothetical protein
MAVKRERVSQYFKLGLPQAALDFVDVDVRRDTPLFVDPAALLIISSEWAAESALLRWPKPGRGGPTPLGRCQMTRASSANASVRRRGERTSVPRS